MNDGCNIIVVDMKKSCQVLPDFTSGFPNQVVDTQPSPSLIHVLIQCTLHTSVFYEERTVKQHGAYRNLCSMSVIKCQKIMKIFSTF